MLNKKLKLIEDIYNKLYIIKNSIVKINLENKELKIEILKKFINILNQLENKINGIYLILFKGYTDDYFQNEAIKNEEILKVKIKKQSIKALHKLKNIIKKNNSRILNELEIENIKNKGMNKDIIINLYNKFIFNKINLIELLYKEIINDIKKYQNKNTLNGIVMNNLNESKLQHSEQKYYGYNEKELKKILKDFYINHKKYIDKIHKKNKLDFLPMNIYEFNYAKPIKSKIRILLHHSSTKYGQGSMYQLMFYDNKIVYARKSNHWGKFSVKNRINDFDYNYISLYWNLIDRDNNIHKSQAGYIVLKDLKDLNNKYLQGNFNKKYKVPKKAKENAKIILNWEKEGLINKKKYMTSIGWFRAKQLASKKYIDYDTIKRMAKFGYRHKKNKEINLKYKDKPYKDKGYVAWLAWGGDEGIKYAQNIYEKEKNQ